MPLCHDEFHQEIYREMLILVNNKQISCAERNYIKHLEHVINESSNQSQSIAHRFSKKRIKQSIIWLKEKTRKAMKPDTPQRRVLAKLYHISARTARKVYRISQKGVAFAKKCVYRMKNTPSKPSRVQDEKKQYAPLSFVAQEEPLVSIIIAVYNKFSYTYHCLESILKYCSDVAYEVIVVDDCSTDETTTLPSISPNIHYVRNQTNQGFLLNCNAAAKLARGKYIALLNNDTLVHEGWLQTLLKLIEQDETIGMVGSKMIYGNGTLQEAGGIVWQDAEGRNYGRGKSPDASDSNYVKDVDYISGASVLIRRNLWEQIQGFDAMFAPAYFEDSDFAFAIRNLGYRVVYQPQSIITHFERVSYGQAAEADSLKQITINRPKFISKWKNELQQQMPNSPANLFRARDRSANRKIVLMMDDYVPMWDQNAGAKTTYNYLLIFRSLGYKIMFVAVNEFDHPEPYTTTLQQLGIEVFYGQYNRELFTKWLQINGHHFDLVFINRPHVANQYLDAAREFTHATIAYYGHDLHYLREQREYELTHQMALLKKSHRDFANEMNIMNKADVVLSVSPVERDLINQTLGKKKAVASPIFFYENRKQSSMRTSQRKNLLFVGGFAHSPNVDGIVWFVKEIWPMIRKKLPGVTLTVVGSKPSKEVQALSCSNIHVTGWLSDEELDYAYAQHRVCVIPLRYGAGVKGKTTDALHHGLPIVSTTIGLEGLPEIETLVTAQDNPDAFADEVIRLYQLTSNEWEAVSTREQNYIDQHFSFASALQLFSNVFGMGVRDEGSNK